MAKRWVTSHRKFHYDEFYVSSRYPAIARAITIQSDDIDIIVLGVESILDPLRISLGLPVNITSGVRDFLLNEKVGGTEDSDHLYACAVDIVVNGMTSYQLAIRLLELGVPYRQIVAYKRKPHVHVSWNIPGRPYKREVTFR